MFQTESSWLWKRTAFTIILTPDWFFWFPEWFFWFFWPPGTIWTKRTSPGPKRTNFEPTRLVLTVEHTAKPHSPKSKTLQNGRLFSNNSASPRVLRQNHVKRPKPNNDTPEDHTVLVLLLKVDATLLIYNWNEGSVKTVAHREAVVGNRNNQAPRLNCPCLRQFLGGPSYGFSRCLASTGFWFFT